jgi:recombination protein RecR
MADAEAKVRVCSTCGNVDTSDPCMICTDQRRDGATIIVVEDVSDLWALERAGAMNVRFHVLGGTLSPLDGVGPDQLNIRQLIGRVAAGGVTEIIIAVNATVEGQTTAHYLIDDLSHFSVKVTRLAHGRSRRGRIGLPRRGHSGGGS